LVFLSTPDDGHLVMVAGGGGHEGRKKMMAISGVAVMRHGRDGHQVNG
jgi:hypothetical protein